MSIVLGSMRCWFRSSWNLTCPDTWKSFRKLLTKFDMELFRFLHAKDVFEEFYKDDIKVKDGAILVAEFINQDRVLKAVRYTNEKNATDYYDENGVILRKAFLRTPLNFSRISSRFNLRRKHPVLNTIRAHRGVDYAAPKGTPIKATGDGTVHFVGRKGGFGKTIILKHGGKYQTLYAHLNGYAEGIKSGARVQQGDIIGYVGSTGMATGPHLHFELWKKGRPINDALDTHPASDECVCFR